MALLLVALLFGWRELQRQMREEPERFPWTKLSLDDPVGPFTGVKLAALGNEPRQCLALLREARLAETPFEQAVPEDSRCRFVDGVRIRPEDGGSINYAPQSLVTACPVAAALALWERDIVQPAAQRHFRTRVVRVDHAGSYSCRRLYGRDRGAWSEHATANAVDITGFALSDGTRISVKRDWDSPRARGHFLREVRDGACRLFATVLSPDYNAAHRDHLHLDQAERGGWGWRACR